MATVTNFFLGANSGGGFYNLFQQLTADGDTYDLMILKGCPGNGKSTFVRRIGAAMEAAGTDVEYIRCSGDPASMDGVLFPKLRCGVVDGTVPHVLEPVYPLAVQRYVDLSRFCDVAAAKASSEEIVRCVSEAKAADVRAGHALMAAAQMERGIRMEAAKTLDTGKLARRFGGIAARELRRCGGERGRVFRRFLGGPTAEGCIWSFDSVDALCSRVYELDDSFGLAAEELEKLCGIAAAKGWDVIACHSPAEPNRIEHLLVPGLELGFVTSRSGMRYPGVPCRRIRVDAMTGISNRGKLRFEGKLASLLKDEAVTALQEARDVRRRLEEIYRPYVDFDAVEAQAAVEASRLLSWMS
ncbi:MAG: hypothetical protein E7445_09065 [Ruminococcaceae bacterium]|nr:hypothetical protein [Oscillospiraceae bacterium]